MNDTVLWSVEGLKLTIGERTIFNDASFSIAENERLAVVGRNGCGKSTLLRIVEGKYSADEGKTFVRRNLRITSMPQDFDDADGRMAEEIISSGLEYFNDLLKRYERISLNSPEHAEIEHILTLHDAWGAKTKVSTAMDKLSIPESTPFSSMSGGEKRRVLLARAIVSEPDLLLLDEPTNHLDAETAEWIEDFLVSYRGACLLVTHDRYFLDRVATRIVELDKGKFYPAGENYSSYLEMKAEREYSEDLEEHKRNMFLRREFEWVRRSPKARLKKNLGRVARYEEIAAIKAPQRTGDVELLLPEPPRLGNKVVELKNVSLCLGGKPLLKDFSYEFTSGQKVGIVGANGTGKTSLLKLITGNLAPDAGTVETADTVIFNYVDQSRMALDPEATLHEEVGGKSDYVNMGSCRISVRAYLKRFLFDDERINQKVKYLSGGEKARLILAKILKTGGNFLILDEPTNDLDLPTLRVLEEALIDFQGTVAVVSHDRYFLDRVCTHVIGFRENSSPTATVGNYGYYREKFLETPFKKAAGQEKAAKKNSPPPTAPVPKNKKKLTWAENKELEGMEDAILGAEERVRKAEEVFQEPDFFAKHGSETQKLQAELDEAKKECERLYARWEELSAKKESL